MAMPVIMGVGVVVMVLLVDVKVEVRTGGDQLTHPFVGAVAAIEIERFEVFDPLNRFQPHIGDRHFHQMQKPQAFDVGDAFHAGIGYLSEDRKHFGLATGMDVRTNVALASLNRFSSRLGVLNEEGMRKTAQDYIGKLEIRTPSDRQEVRLLSGGNQQKVVIAKWLYRDCDILIFDEPTRGIDVGAKSEIYKLLKNLADEGRAVIVISSELPEVMRLSHRIAVMCEGRLTGILPGGEETSQEDIMHLATLRAPSMQPEGYQQ